MKLKKIAHVLHLWLGLPAGLLVCVIALTGSLYVFKPDIEWLTQPYRRVANQEVAQLPPSTLGANARASLPGKTLQTLKYTADGRSVEALFYAYDPPYYLSVFLNPYTGEVLKVHDNNKGFFAWVLDGHAYLWLKPSIGRTIVATATLVFVLILLTGLFLWWPKNRKGWKRALWFTWTRQAGVKRKVFDTHNIPGFYVFFFALAVSLTGLVWGFQWFSEATYTLTGGTKALFAPTPTSAALPNTTEPTFMSLNTALDRVFERMLKENPDARVVGIQFPTNDSAAIGATANASSSTYWKTDYRYFDRHTLTEIPSSSLYGRIEDASGADLLRRMNYDIHVGSIGGWAGKCLLFFVSLFIASLPVSGFLIWWQRRKRK